MVRILLMAFGFVSFLGAQQLTDRQGTPSDGSATLQRSAGARGGTVSNISTETLYVLFLSSQAEALSRTALASNKTRVAHAARLRIMPQELDSVERAALWFRSQEMQLREEAVRYVKAQDAVHQPRDRAMIQLFTTRRQSLAVSAFAMIQKEITASSFVGLQQFLRSTFAPHIHQVRP